MTAATATTASGRSPWRSQARGPHLVCTRCGKIEDVDLDGISALAAEAAAATGYEIRSHRVDFYGLCAGCR